MKKIGTTSLVEELRDITNEALRLHEENQQQKAAQEEARRPEYELQARVITNQIDERTKTEAKLMRRYAPIMSIRECRDFERSKDSRYVNGECKPEWLKGAAKLVYTFLVKEGLAPTIEYWNGEDDAGFNIIAHW